jgi:tetratricopeptide (TPR) repeat protein
MAAAAQREIAAAVSLDEHGVLERVAQAAYGLCFYVLKTLWPANLSCHHLLEIDFQWNRPLHLAAIASVVLVTAVAVVRASRWPALLATWFLYGVLVSPVLGLFQSGAQKVADRYAHLAAMPFSLLLAGAALVYATRAGDDVVLGRRARVVAVLTAGLALVLGVLSNVQTRVWKDSETLFRRAAEVEPVNYFVLHNLAVALYRRQAYAEALEVERRSVEAHPNKGNEEARYTLALLHSLLGRADEAEAEWRRTLEIEPTHQNSFNALKPRMLNRGGAAEWTQFLEQLVAKRPDALTATLELEQHYAASQRFDAIVDLWQRALASDKVPRTQAELGLARGYVGSRRFAEAEPLALRAAPADRGAKFVLDALAAAQGSHAAALEFWERARRARVPAAMVENGIGKAHLAAGRLAEAEAALLRAQALDPRDKDYVIDVCELFVRQNRLDDARTNVRAVLAVDPAFPRALELERRLGARRP